VPYQVSDPTKGIVLLTVSRAHRLERDLIPAVRELQAPPLHCTPTVGPSAMAKTLSAVGALSFHRAALLDPSSNRFDRGLHLFWRVVDYLHDHTAIVRLSCLGCNHFHDLSLDVFLDLGLGVPSVIEACPALVELPFSVERGRTRLQKSAHVHTHTHTHTHHPRTPTHPNLLSRSCVARIP
jgi:hypothetical protein